MLRDDLSRHIALQQTLGFKFRTQASLLRSFVTYAEASGDRYIRTERVLAWATLAPSAPQRRNRLLMVRRFAVPMQAEDARHEVPAADAFGRGLFVRITPHIYSADEIARLMSATATLAKAGSIRPLIYSTLFGLLAATGMRISEALALKTNDVTADGLIIRATKFQKSRMLPLHATAERALERYLAARAKLAINCDALFVSDAAQPLSYNTVEGMFLRLARSIGLRGAPGNRGPRIHDLRHTFAVRSLERCQEDSVAVSRHMLALSTYLGHAHVTDTYWYLRATPILLEKIAAAGESLHQGGAT